ncbi:hypothetical protein DN826_07555 [Stutzerimonas nosocomialis]|uniref:PA0061/PA0062 family lipoprotein n=1 Tax=Stutzerimonas nosocomialis TaxID=1056496 RepID=UPI001108061D|nr:hypothetical protein [Stutzerimonas nosocomialis]TLX57726.1 hypothetical protein DN826_07555 [Stutzerimonas nosocomialis]
MRRSLVLSLLLILSGCAGPLPEPRDDRAWVDLHTMMPIDTFMAQRIDRQRVEDGRFFQVPPGPHALEASFEFEIGGGGMLNEPRRLRCLLTVNHDFEAGRRYRFESRAMGFQPQGWLYDEQDNLLTRADVSFCGP